MNGIRITFENPFITGEMADSIYANVNNFTYTPCSIKWRGNPAIQTGDMVQAIDGSGVPHNVLVMSQSLKVGGGCNATIECKGQGETTSQFSNKFEPVGQKIERIYSTIEKAILDATNRITGNSGGYVVLNDTNHDSKPDELLIMDVEDIRAATQVWRWNKEGLGYAYNAEGNAYNGSFRTAITADGQINADFITTGLLNADIIQIGDEKLGEYIRLKDGIMHFGSVNNPMSLRLGNINETQQVALYSGETRIAYFSSNSFEIENLNEGKIRFQNFGFITRKSGNLSFTKLT